MQLTGGWIRDERSQAVCAMLTGAGYQALFVGGCVRDGLLNVAVGDIDIATDARPQDVIRLAGEAGFRCLPTGIDHGTVTIIARGRPHEITTFRRDVKTDGRHAEIVFGNDVAQDAGRRDFTMNALYADARGNVIDPLGGLPDLQAGRVCFIGDAQTRIREDYLRILRFFRFHAWYGDPAAGLDADALAAIAGNRDGLSRLSRERVGLEMLKLLGAADPAASLAAMRAAGVLNCILPGATIDAIGLLVHFETEAALPPDPIRRLALIGGESVQDNLRLSNAQTGRYSALRAAAQDPFTLHELGYRFGAVRASDIVLLRAAWLETPPPDMIRILRHAETARFPVRAADLMPAYTGAALGQRLRELEQRWIDSEFQLTRAELLK